MAKTFPLELDPDRSELIVLAVLIRLWDEDDMPETEEELGTALVARIRRHPVGSIMLNAAEFEQIWRAFKDLDDPISQSVVALIPCEDLRTELSLRSFRQDRAASLRHAMAPDAV